MKIHPCSKLLFIGDSITDAGRAQPVGEGKFGALGNGYVQLAASLLGAAYPGHRIRIVNQGLSGNTVRDLKRRWETDVLAVRPDWLSICIGINDVWRQFDQPDAVETHVLPTEYRQTLEELILATKPGLRGLILMTPYFLDPNRSDAMRRRIEESAGIVRELAGVHAAVLVDLQDAFDVMLENMHGYALSPDRVHLTPLGNMVLVRALLDALDFQWNSTGSAIGTENGESK